MAISTIMVIGAGQMGGGIAQVAAEHGLQVILNDINPQLIEQRLAYIDERLDRTIERGENPVEKKADIRSRITPSTDLQDAAQADFVIEAAAESKPLKQQLFRELDALSPPHVILASNTSSLSITDLAAATTRPELVIGMHFMNPVPVMALVEVVRGLATSAETCDRVKKLAGRLDKTPVEVKDYPALSPIAC